jgi:hypothetical protein
VQDYRVDERQRQQACRERRGKGDCHAPPSRPKSAQIKAQVLESWDRAMALSRASLERRLPVILRAISGLDGTTQVFVGPPSRASLPSQVAGNAGD